MNETAGVISAVSVARAVSLVACAASGVTVGHTTAHTVYRADDWHDTDWRKCNRNVQRLQARIVKATQEGRHGKVKALQWMLTHSYSGKAIAVRRVTENHGKNTPGVDGETWSTPEAKSNAVKSLKRRGYKPQPLRRVYIPKRSGKRRPLGIPAMKDRAMQALYLLALEAVAETTGDGHSYGFRKWRSCADAIEQCYNIYKLKTSAEWVLECDIQGCFDNISHDWLIANVPMDKVMLRKWLAAGYLEERTLHPTLMGTPQGGVISPVLANLALDGLERLLQKRFPEGNRGKERKWHSQKVNMVRYADDFIISGCSKELLENEVRPVVEQFLKERGLALSSDKTRVTHINEGFDFLGFNVRKYGQNDGSGKLLIKPSKTAVHDVLEKIRKTLRERRTATPDEIIKRLNPIIIGWTNYYRYVVSKRTFKLLDHRIWEALWRWAKRRHQNKGRKWVKDRYFKRVGARDWTFVSNVSYIKAQNSAQGITKSITQGKSYIKSLARAGDVKIRRYSKVKINANPFSPECKQYYKERIARKIQQTKGVNPQSHALWVSQRGVCLICGEIITEDRGWHAHHLHPKSKGGSNSSSNLTLLHPNCHRQVHSRNLRIVKPLPLQQMEGV